MKVITFFERLVEQRRSVKFPFFRPRRLRPDQYTFNGVAD